MCSSYSDGLPKTRLPQLYFGRNLRIHQRRAAVRINDLPRYPACFFRTKECRNVSDVFRRPQTPHWSPSACVPIPDQILCLLRQSIQDAVLSVGNSENSSSITHERNGFANADEKRLGLRIERRIPLLEGDLHGRVKKRGCLWACVADKDVELAKFILNLAEHLGDLFGAQHIGLDHEATRAELAHLRQRLDRRSLVLVVMDSYIDAARRQFQGDSSTNATRAAGYQRVFSFQRHINLLKCAVQRQS